jgi:hypothetical protein
MDLDPRRWKGSVLCFEALFFVFRVKVCGGGVQVVMTAPRVIRSPRCQSHLDGNIERFVGVVWSSGFCLAMGSSDRQGASSAVLPSSSSSGRMWSS